MNFSDQINKIGFKAAYKYLDKDPEKNLPKLIDWVDKLCPENVVKPQREAVRKVIEEKTGNWYQLMLSLWTDVDAGVRERMFENFVLYANILANPKEDKYRKQENCNIPWAILLDPTSACNLKCLGCWASEYGNTMSLSFDELDSIINQGKELGTYMYLYTGGEPLIRREDIIALCNKHSDCTFLAFTNGTLIDEEFAEEMLRVKNFIPAISVEGFEKETDFRRGKGTFKKVEKAMALLREKKLPFGISCCYTKETAEVIGSEAYFDQMVNWGAKFCWFFTYMPVGRDAMPELMATAEQREYMYHQIRNFRKTKPIFTMDFWNDAEYVGGCIAGGRNYCHINANGDIEPCAFIHYSDSNIREKTLLEAYKSPLFMAYHDNQPFNCNHLRPCPVLDNPGKLTELVEKTQARSTDFLEPETPKELCDKCVNVAEGWKIKADELWEGR